MHAWWHTEAAGAAKRVAFLEREQRVGRPSVSLYSTLASLQPMRHQSELGVMYGCKWWLASDHGALEADQ